MSYDNMRIGGVGRTDPYTALANIYEALAQLLGQPQLGPDGQPATPGGVGGPGGHHRHHGHHGHHGPDGQGCHGGPSAQGGEGPGGADGSGPSGGSSGAGGGLGAGGTFDAGPNDALQPYSQDISNASQITGIDPNTLGAQIWAESRGNPDESSTNSDGTEDMGLMQIGQERWQNDVLPNVTDEERARVKELTNKNVEDLDITDPHDNIIAGSLELSQHVRDKGGDLDAGLMDYMDGGDESIGNRNYVDDIKVFADQLRNGQQLSDEDPN